MSLALAVLAEHLTMGTPLAELVGRLGVNDRSEIAAAALEVEQAAGRLRDLVAPRLGTSTPPSPVGGQRGTPPPRRFINRFPGPCRKCTRKVPQGAGWAVLDGSRWGVECKSCNSPMP